MAKRKIYQKGYQYRYCRNQSGNNNTGNIFFVVNASVANFFDANPVNIRPVNKKKLTGLMLTEAYFGGLSIYI